ncbi:MAG: GNAT family N-acetyltransferase [Candidatus Ratteibacteria bacterium]|nr:GNAT family N-acetyltransferase [Candidatus Ratteibacteria bacterium]
MKIERALSSEYNNIQRFLEDVYGHSFNYFPSTYPSLWKKENTDFRNIFVIREKGKIVSLVRVFPLKTVQNGVDIDLAGIGGVSTLYSHRGKGYMGILLKYAFKEMERQRFPLSILGGDRHRYNNFGYENGGKVVTLNILPRGLEKYGINAIPSYRYDNTDRKILGKIMRSYEDINYRRKRTLDDFENIYKRYGINVYYAERGKRFAFVVISATEVRDDRMKNVLEFGGSPELIPCILQHLIEKFGFAGFSIVFPEFHEIPANLMSLASSWNIGSPRMIKIINLRQTMEIFSKGKNFLFPDNEEITLTIKGKESVVITKKGDVLKIVSGRGKNEISLTETDMVRFLFGTSLWVPDGIDIKTVQILKQFLPLNIYLPPLDMI